MQEVVPGIVGMDSIHSMGRVSGKLFRLHSQCLYLALEAVI